MTSMFRRTTLIRTPLVDVVRADDAPGAARWQRLAPSLGNDADRREDHGESGECGRRKRGDAG